MVTYLGMPGISEGFHAKMSLLPWKEVDERAFLFGGERGTNAYHFFLGTARVYEDLLGALHCVAEPPKKSGPRAPIDVSTDLR